MKINCWIKGDPNNHGIFFEHSENYIFAFHSIVSEEKVYYKILELLIIKIIKY